MGRYYHLSKKVTKEQSKEIIREMKELAEVEQVEITQDQSYLKVVARDDQFYEVMSKAVNICNRITEGIELSFSRFAVEG